MKKQHPITWEQIGNIFLATIIIFFIVTTYIFTYNAGKNNASEDFYNTAKHAYMNCNTLTISQENENSISFTPQVLCIREYENNFVPVKNWNTNGAK